MTRVHRLAGAAGSAASDATHAAYYASIAQADEARDGTVRHRLRPEIGDGTIEVTPLDGGIEIVRYDVAFAGEHRVSFSFPEDHFELEYCVDGRLHVRDNDSGHGELRAGSTAVSPRRATDGVVAHGEGERYRAVSIAGTWTGLASRVDGLGAGPLPGTGPEGVARERYRSGSAALRPVAVPLGEIFADRRSSPGRLLFLQSRVVAALAGLVDALATPDPVRTGGRALDEHEVAALRRVPDLLWAGRQAPPTLAELARASSMSVRRLTSGFRELYGTSVMDHHRRRCLERAATLLAGTDWPVARIGHEVGYASASNFVHAFRRDRGVTPARFRQAHA